MIQKMQQGLVSLPNIVLVLPLVGCGLFVQFPVSFLYGLVEKRTLLRLSTTRTRTRTLQEPCDQQQQQHQHQQRQIRIIQLCRIVGYIVLHIVLHRLQLYFLRLTIKSNDSSFNTISSIESILLLLQSIVLQYYGIYYGQLFCPIVITGGIATGKSTVVQQMQLLESRQASEGNQPNPYSSDDNNCENTNKKDSTKMPIFYIVDTDSIGHGILLSPQRITKLQRQQQQQQQLSNANSSNNPWHPKMVVTAKDSIYYQIIKVFGDPTINNANLFYDDPSSNSTAINDIGTNNNNIGEIDRRKLGNIIFQNPTQRRLLNRITHPQIIKILLRQLIYGTYYFIDYDKFVSTGSNDIVATVTRFIRILQQPLCSLFLSTTTLKDRIVCADIPLFYESNSLFFRYLFSSCILIVACTPQIQLQRLQTRNTDLTKEQCEQRIASQLPIDEKVRLYGSSHIGNNTIVIFNNGTVQELQDQIHDATIELQRRFQYGQFSTTTTYYSVYGAFLLLIVIYLFYAIHSDLNT